MNAAVAPVRYMISEAEYVEAATHANARGAWRVAAVVTAFALLVALLKPQFQVAILCGMVLGLALTAFKVMFLLPRRAAQIYHAQASMREPFELALTDEQFESAQRSGSFRNAWTDFVKWDETANMLLLYVDKAMFVSLPKAQVGTANLAFIRARLAATGLEQRNRSRKPEDRKP
ncbi:YcxB family protein [Glacieibacterium sp.]|uniref:YcxB family protein n=1 Tax=Glacieibacterium sp. TaxID=2860237 RepID=UPI003B00729E